MRVCVVGAGVAGSLLAWRLIRAGVHVDVIGGRPDRPDATAASGGLVRGFEPDTPACRLAADSLGELRADPTLARWAAYREIGSVYACAGRTAAELAPLLSEVDERLPGSATLVDPAGLSAGHGWLDPPADLLAVVERHAGWLSPDRLRQAVLTDAARLGARLTPGEAGPVTALTGRYDAVVLAAGRWTPRLLAAARLDTGGLRTKAIQYGLHAAAAGERRAAAHPASDAGRTAGGAGGVPWSPPAFVDESTGLWGRPAADGLVLLGVPSDRWDVDPDRPEVDEAMHRRVAELAADRFGVAVGPPRQVVASADAYGDPPLLALRPVPAVPGLHTFTGGSGGAAKSALAASRLAAAQLTRSDPSPPEEVSADAATRSRAR